MTCHNVTFCILVGSSPGATLVCVGTLCLCGRTWTTGWAYVQSPSANMSCLVDKKHLYPGYFVFIQCSLKLKKKKTNTVIFLVALDLYCYTWAVSSCSVQASHCSSFSCCRAQALECVSSVAAACWLSCPEVYEILVPQAGIEPESSALQSRFFFFFVN